MVLWRIGLLKMILSSFSACALLKDAIVHYIKRLKIAFYPALIYQCIAFANSNAAATVCCECLCEVWGCLNASCSKFVKRIYFYVYLSLLYTGLKILFLPLTQLEKPLLSLLFKTTTVKSHQMPYNL